jgi:hypothetical protein
MPCLRAACCALICLCLAGAAVADDDARSLLAQAEAQVRVDPEGSRRMAERVLELLRDAPDVDLQVQALLLL